MHAQAMWPIAQPRMPPPQYEVLDLVRLFAALKPSITGPSEGQNGCGRLTVAVQTASSKHRVVCPFNTQLQICHIRMLGQEHKIKRLDHQSQSGDTHSDLLETRHAEESIITEILPHLTLQIQGSTTYRSALWNEQRSLT